MTLVTRIPRSLVSTFLNSRLVSTIAKLTTCKISGILLASVAEYSWLRTTSSLTLKTGFLATRPIYYCAPSAILFSQRALSSNMLILSDSAHSDRSAHQKSPCNACDIHFFCIDTYSYSCFNLLSNELKSMFKSGDSGAV